MDLEEWELVSKNSFKGLDLDLDLDHDEDYHGAMMNDYFLCPSTQDPLYKTESPPRSIVVPTMLLQVPIAWEPVLDHENKSTPNDPVLDPDPKLILSTDPDPKPILSTDPDPKPILSTDSVSSPRVSFKKLKETEFADMKIDPSAKITSPSPRIDDAKTSDSERGDDLTNDRGGDQSLNLWKIGRNGIGAICSLGVAAAAATVCVFFLGHNNIKICKNTNNQMLRFQIYSDDNKRMKKVVNKATKLNEAIFAMKGVPVVKAQISFGGHYDGL